MANKKDIEKRLKFAYQNKSITLLKRVKEQALEEGHWDVAEKAVTCMNALANPFILYL